MPLKYTKSYPSGIELQERLKRLHSLPKETLKSGSREYKTSRTLRKGLFWDIEDRDPRPIVAPVKTTTFNDDGSSLVMGSNYSLPQVWSAFLEPYNWDWFTTITVEGTPHPESVDKLFDVFIHRLNRDIYGQHYWKDKKKGVFYACGNELQKRGILHKHALMGGIPHFVSRNMHYIFLREHGAKMSLIEPYRKQGGAEYYMTKFSYAYKRAEIDLSDTMKHEKAGTRICGKDLFADYCRRYKAITRPDIASFDFS